jgi:predicted ATPase
MVLTDMGSAAEARVLADRSADMARSRGLRPWATLSGIAQGLIMVDLGEVNKGLSWFQEHLNAWEREQGAFHCGEFCGLMVDRLLRAGWMQQAFDLVLHAQELYRDLSERMYAAELLRLRSRFRELEGDLDGAEAGYGEALALATQQGADRLALRAADSLGRLWLARAQPGSRVQELLVPLLNASMIPRSHAEWQSAHSLVEQARGG